MSRSRNATGQDPSGVGPWQVLGDWTLNIPRISTLVPAPRYVEGGGIVGENWRMWVTNDENSRKRCTNFGDIYVGQGGIPLEDWWHGYELMLADGSAQPLLKRDPAFTAKPLTGQAYPAVTLSDVQVSCLPATTNGQAGEAFLAMAPDGTKYYFNWLVGLKGSPAQDLDTSTGDTVYIVQERMQAAMYVTRIEDRFNNRIDYTYDTSNRLTSISSPDGRLVKFTWNGNQLASAIAQPDTADERTWSYEYSGWKLWHVYYPT